MLPQCQNCHSTFGFKRVYRYLMGPQYKPLICPDCGQEHFTKVSGRLAGSLLMIGPLWVFVQFLSPFSNIFLTIGSGFCLGIIGSLLSPYLIKLEQPAGKTKS
ncbi:TIGR04104 family putative zinc finger protein [Lysinibacillus sphaericus]